MKKQFVLATTIVDPTSEQIATLSAALSVPFRKRDSDYWGGTYYKAGGPGGGEEVYFFGNREVADDAAAFPEVPRECWLLRFDSAARSLDDVAQTIESTLHTQVRILQPRRGQPEPDVVLSVFDQAGGSLEIPIYRNYASRERWWRDLIQLLDAVRSKGQPHCSALRTTLLEAPPDVENGAVYLRALKIRGHLQRPDWRIRISYAGRAATAIYSIPSEDYWAGCADVERALGVEFEKGPHWQHWGCPYWCSPDGQYHLVYQTNRTREDSTCPEEESSIPNIWIEPEHEDSPWLLEVVHANRGAGVKERLLGGVPGCRLLREVDEQSAIDVTCCGVE